MTATDTPQGIGSLKRTLSDNIHWAIEELASKGYRIRSEISYAIDPSLKIMGYTSQSAGSRSQQIIVSKWAVYSPMLKGLLIHEITHIIRTEEGHPSHNFLLLSSILNDYSLKHELSDKDTSMLREALQHVQDIYADDIGFLIFRDSLDRSVIEDFFTSWVKDYGPSENNQANLEGTNQIASTIASNAFALASLKRRGYNSSAKTKIRKANSRFLKQAFPNTSFERVLDIYSKIVQHLTSLPHSDLSEEKFKNEIDVYFDKLSEAKALALS